MKEYIERNALIAELEDDLVNDINMYNSRVDKEIRDDKYTFAIEALDSAPVVDVKEKSVMELKRYLLQKDNKELKEIEKDLAEHLGVPFVRCDYDGAISHKYREKEEIKYRRKMIDDANDTHMVDFIINYEIYSTKEGYDTCNYGCGGDDGEVHELHYLKGNGKYIVIVGGDIDF